MGKPIPSGIEGVLGNCDGGLCMFSSQSATMDSNYFEPKAIKRALQLWSRGSLGRVSTLGKCRLTVMECFLWQQK